jgi:hypothetical protein
LELLLILAGLLHEFCQPFLGTAIEWIFVKLPRLRQALNNKMDDSLRLVHERQYQLFGHSQ